MFTVYIAGGANFLCQPGKTGKRWSIHITQMLTNTKKR